MRLKLISFMLMRLQQQWLSGAPPQNWPFIFDILLVCFIRQSMCSKMRSLCQSSMSLMFCLLQYCFVSKNILRWGHWIKGLNKVKFVSWVNDYGFIKAKDRPVFLKIIPLVVCSKDMRVIADTGWLSHSKEKRIINSGFMK